MRKVRAVAAAALLVAVGAAAQVVGGPPPEPPARSSSEAVALAYIRTTLTAQRLYKKKNGAYATSLQALVNTGSFTRRMARTDRRDYTVSFRGGKERFSIVLNPKVFAPDHRSFYADQTGTIRAEEGKAATAESPPVRE